MQQNIEEFIDSICKNDLVVFFFAGHGTQWNDQNYLLPVDNDRIKTRNNLKTKAINAQDTLERMSNNEPAATIFLLDCCRDYCIENEALIRSGTRGGSALPTGLTGMRTSRDSMIVFACAPGKLAKDVAKNGRNGLFTFHLLQHVARCNEDIDKVMRYVSTGVSDESNGEQQLHRVSLIETPHLSLNTVHREIGIDVAIHSTPESWPIENVIQWLESIGLGEVIKNFKDNDIDGSLLMSDGLDDTVLKELITQLKYRILFKIELAKLKSKSQQKSIISTTDSNVTCITLKSTDTSEMLSMTGNTSQASVTNDTQGCKIVPAGRVGAKAICHAPNRHVSNRNIQINLKDLLNDANCVHSTAIDAKYFTNDDYKLLKKWWSCLCSEDIRQSIGLDQTFNTLVDETINAQTLIEELTQNHSITAYIVDSLKRYHSLMDIIHILPSCNQLDLAKFPQQRQKSIQLFCNVIGTITKSVLLTTTIHSMSYESQRYFGNFIKKNDLPVPFAYYMWNKEINSIEYKINFNLLSEIMCLTNGQYILQIGSESTFGMGKTSMLQYIFPDKRTETLNTDGSSTLRNGCIDVLCSPDEKNQKDESHTIFDVHGTINIFNEDIITSIQTYCSLQILYVTEEDLNGVFLNSMMNYSECIKTKPTIVVIFDPNYDDKRDYAEKIINTFLSQYGYWKNIRWITAPPSQLWYRRDNNKKSKDLTRSQRLLKSFETLRQSTNAEVQKQIKCTSIFSILSYYLTVKTSTNSGAPIHYYFEIEDRLKQLFDDLNETTENLRITTPVSYLDSAIKQCEKELLNNWDASPKEIQTRKENLIRERSKIITVNSYTGFFIDLLTKCSYTELLITKKYLEKWRSQFESTLLEQLSKAKVEASKLSSRIKQIEERLSTQKNFNHAEKTQMQQELHNVKSKFDQQLRLVNEINQKLLNIDLTIGLFCDEIMALYELSPHMFNPPTLIQDIAKAFVSLMQKGFPIHILRGRPLQCQSRLIDESIKFLSLTTHGPPLVLTVIGEQSSAKSSLMNTTFGCNFRVSPGRCTIGMYMSVIRWKSKTIVIFDTEGLLSLEEAGSIFDNQMITMAVLSSHLVLINHKGEVSSNLKDLIGMSFYAKLNIQSPIKPKLLFVLRDQADLSSKQTFFRQLTELKDQLQNDSKFLKTSIDDELEINNENVYLLPNAFSHYTDAISNIPRCWRNQTFPQEIIKLRQIIFNNITSTTKPRRFYQINRTSAIEPQSSTIDATYIDMTHLYTKISSNWEAIDRLGSRLLECKTLHELSILKELQTIANEIIKTANATVFLRVESLIERTLLEFSSAGCIVKELDTINNKFNDQLTGIITYAVNQAQMDFNDKTERSCYLPEIKSKVSRYLEPTIHSAQHLLRKNFETRIIDASKKAQVNSAQKQLLIKSVQAEFDEHKSLELNDLKNRPDMKFQSMIEQHRKNLQSSSKTNTEIIRNILKFYNSQLLCKQRKRIHGSIYELLSPIHDEGAFQTYFKKFEICLSWSVRKTMQQVPHKYGGYWKGFKSWFTGPLDKYIDFLWENLKDDIKWFTNSQKVDKNKETFAQIWSNVILEFQENLLTSIEAAQSFSSYSMTVQHLVQHIENAMNSPYIIKGNCIEKHIFCSDLVVIGLDTIITEAIAKEKSDYELNLQNSTNTIKECQNNLYKQCTVMNNSFELGRTLAEIIGKQIIKEISHLLQRKIDKDIKEDLMKSQFINHEAIQKRAYAESISQANGENILKYIYDINRYFTELSLKEIKTTLHTITHHRTLKFEHLIIKAINTANQFVQEHTYYDTVQLKDGIRNAILDIPELKLKESLERELCLMFLMNNVIRIPINDEQLFKQGFANISTCYKDIEEKITDLTKNIKSKAFNSCKQSIAPWLGCQVRCPGCGAKCSKPEPHHKEEIEVWQDSYTHPKPRFLETHESTYHLAPAFHGRVHHQLRTPCLELCYQRWTTIDVHVGKQRRSNNLQNEKSDETEDEIVFPKAKYYNERHPAWYNSLKKQSTEGNACNESIPPPDQRRAWMVVRHAIVNRYKSSMIDNKEYDDKSYPLNVEALPADFEPQWKDENFE
ncbi:unnamed protein product [Adineta steineri]|uniref:VLIG-type G domain-containing protein n=1 Tax=Adineta steineri TaxID=433720 RepID=A0A814RTM5_9BILA|nr:unnamed protein product [Adineta steineri]CAF1285733.1 unnamed protein product [Adineta steineri]